MLDLRRVASVDELVDAVRAIRGRLPPETPGCSDAATTRRRCTNGARRRAPISTARRPIARSCSRARAVTSTPSTAPRSSAPASAPTRRRRSAASSSATRAGEPNGLLHETAMGLINRVHAAADRGRLRGDDRRGARGISCRSASPRRPTAASRRSCCRSTASLEREGRLPVARQRDAAAARGRRAGAGAAAGAVRRPTCCAWTPSKFLADGGLSGATAALSVNYRHAPQQGRAAVRARRAARAVPRDPRRRLADRHARHRRRRHRSDARHLREPRAASTRPRASHRAFRSARRARSSRARRGLRVIAAPQTIFIHSLGRNFRELPAGHVAAADLSDPRDARRRRPRRAVVGRARGRGRQPARRHDGGGHAPRQRGRADCARAGDHGCGGAARLHDGRRRRQR